MNTCEDFITLETLHGAAQHPAEGDLLLDVRTPREFNKGYIEGSKNITHKEVADHLEELRPYKKIYVYCQAGRRAQYIYTLLKGHGFENVLCYAEGGFKEWNDAGYPKLVNEEAKKSFLRFWQ